MEVTQELFTYFLANLMYSPGLEYERISEVLVFISIHEVSVGNTSVLISILIIVLSEPHCESFQLTHGKVKGDDNDITFAKVDNKLDALVGTDNTVGEIKGQPLPNFEVSKKLN